MAYLCHRMVAISGDAVLKKSATVAEKAWFTAVASIPFCVICGGHDQLQVAHRNRGKGMGMKTAAYFTARLCREDHERIDQYKGLTRDESRALMDDAILRTHEVLILGDRLQLK